MGKFQYRRIGAQFSNNPKTTIIKKPVCLAALRNEDLLALARI